MTTVVDANVFAALWDADEALNTAAKTALDSASSRGRLMAPGPVFAELLAFPKRDEAFLDAFFRDTGILVVWDLPETVWRSAGKAFGRYAAVRKRGGPGPRRILADFLIGAYAEHSGSALLTLDRGVYRSAFPSLTIVVL